jgi:hypothetical protein
VVVVVGSIVIATFALRVVSSLLREDDGRAVNRAEVRA